MKRILFVDDDVQVLGALQASLRKKRAEWHTAFADGGEAAVTLLRSQHFDVVVSDMHMPKMDGAALLRIVKEEFPGTIRIVLSGYAERDSLMRAIPVSHQFMAKPCDGPTLVGAIERACGLHALLESEVLRRLVGGTDKLPSLPSVYWELAQTMADPDVSAKEIATVVQQDPAISAKLLQLVNSSYFGLARRTSSVEGAIVYLGCDLVRSLCLTSQVFCAADRMPAVRGLSYGALQEHALLTAAVAKVIAPDAKKADEAFTAGLLHDIGKLVLAIAIPNRVAEILTSSLKDGRPTHVVELEALGVTHAEVGAYLLGLWGLPVPIVEAVAYHHAPTNVPHTSMDTLATVHIADSLVAPHDSSEPYDPSRPTLDPAYLEALGVASEVTRWSAVVSHLVERRNSKRAGTQ
jgi:HD-like signal output (HDOD) protein/CheY-like chemotaxis protein